MASGADLYASTSIRMLLGGMPGSAKTGSLAGLLNAGYKLRVLNFEGANYQTMLAYANPEVRANADIVTFKDRTILGEKFIKLDGLPTAFADMMKLLQHWKYTNPDGTVVDLGRSREWGGDTVVVVDGLRGLVKAIRNRAMAANNKTPLNLSARVWGFAVDDLMAFLGTLNDPAKAYHSIITSHLQMIGPDDLKKADDDEDEPADANVAAKVQKQVANLMETRLFPTGVTRNSSMSISGEFSTFILAEKRPNPISKKMERVLRTDCGAELDLKFPVPDAPKEVPIKDGMATLFKLLGASPGV